METASLQQGNVQASVPENACNNSKNAKSHVFWIFKNVKKRTYIFSWLFNVYSSSSLLSESDTAQRSHSVPCGRLSWLLVCLLSTLILHLVINLSQEMDSATPNFYRRDVNISIRGTKQLCQKN